MPDINESLAEFGLQIDVWPLERFKVYDRNPRAHPEENIKNARKDSWNKR